MPTTLAKQAPTSLQVDCLPRLTINSPCQACRVCVVVPVRNEAEHLPAMLKALTQQVDTQGHPLDPDSYEVLLLANNCTDGSADLARAWGLTHPQFNFHVLDVNLPQSQACVGYARQLVMNEAYQRLMTVGLNRRIIASTDGDTEVSPTWLATMVNEFDQGLEHGVEAVFGRILTRRTTALGIQAKTSLYFLRYMAHRYLTAQLEACLDPLPHDGWPRHYQHFGANLAILAETYGRIGGMPSVVNQEDVALYRRLQQVDAKIRHSPQVKVVTSARCWGRTEGGLAERMGQLAQASCQRQTVWVESPWLTEARILVRRQLPPDLGGSKRSRPRPKRTFWRSTRLLLLAQWLGLTKTQLGQAIEAAPTFGLLLEALENEQKQERPPPPERQQKQGAEVNAWGHRTVEISLANMHLRQRVQMLLNQGKVVTASVEDWGAYTSLEALKQVQPIPLFSLTY
ncbi:MAG: glycosyltransferase [Leptolyngbyaceae cyanobacterium SM2_3_12]|nr:glycosyltransferase [Leptolyngbyaceae cyanobacterium SM2_3_12]